MKRNLLIAVSVLFLFGITTIRSFAMSTVYLSKGQEWTTSYSASRTMAFSYVSSKLYSVYPEKGKDNFKKIQVRVVDGSGTLISNSTYSTLTEGAGWNSIALKDGYLNYSTVYFQFRGNSSEAAYADVDYYGN